MAALLLLALSALAPVARAGVSVALEPGTMTVAPSAEFDLFIAVTQSGSAFNGFDAVIGYDPEALTLLVLSPLSLQQGSLMGNACSNTFHRFREGVDSDTIADVLLCSGVSVTGPGQIYRLHFRASSTPQNTVVRFLNGLKFYDAGIQVTPVSSGDATIQIGTSVDVPPPAPAGRLRIRAMPNPMRAHTSILVETDRPGTQTLSVCDARGRIVRRLEFGRFASGTRSVPWDGRNDSGSVVPSGVYFIRLEAGGHTVRTRIALVR